MKKPYKHIYRHYNYISGREYKGERYCKLLDAYVVEHKIQAVKDKKHHWITERALYEMMPDLMNVMEQLTKYFVKCKDDDLYCGDEINCRECQTKKIIHISNVLRLEKLYNFS